MKGCEFPAQVFPDPSAAVDKRISHKGKVFLDRFSLRMLRNKREKAGRAAQWNCASPEGNAWKYSSGIQDPASELQHL